MCLVHLPTFAELHTVPVAFVIMLLFLKHQRMCSSLLRL